MPEYCFDEIAINSKEKKKPTEEDKYTYIGLEHLDTGSLTVSRWGSEIAPTGDKLVMRKGDVLFGKRRAYQKKVAIAPFDGIFSAHGMVLRPREEVITKDFFPLFISSDYFLDEAIKISVGSLSPTINWSDLKELSFTIPSLEEQKKLAPVIWAAIDTKNAYKKLLLGIDELVKSQFIEQFVLDKSHPREQLRGNIVEMFIGPFGSALKNDCFVEESNAYCMVYEQKHAIQKSMDLPTRYVDEKKFRELARFNIQPGDVIVSCRGTIGEVFVVPDNAPMGIMHPSIMKVRLNRKRYNNVFFAMLLEHYMEEHKQEANGTGVKMAVSASTLEKECFVIPEKSIQDAFVAFAEQSDKSKFVDLQTTISELYTCRIKSLSIYGGQCYAE